MIGLNIEQPKEETVLVEKDPNFPKVYDEGAFTIDKGDHGFQSFDREGHKLVFSGSEWECEFWSRKCLQAQQEGWSEDMSRVVNDGRVGGKL
jgi:hypothetical protein